MGYKAAGWPADSTVARYGYDVLGRRIVKRVYTAGTGGTAQYLRMIYHGEQVAFETDSGGTIGWKYVWGLGTDRLLVAQNGSNTYWTATDKLGSVRAHMGTAQGFQWHTPYAEVTTTEGTWAGLRYGWTGRELDAETGFYFLRARYFDPKQRRFTQEDPIGEAGGANLYAYVGGAVLEARDPSGMYKEWMDIGKGFAEFCTPSGNYLSSDGSFTRGGCAATVGGGVGGGIIDNNNDGLDDFDQFAEYAWGWQTFRINGGNIEQYHALDFIITYGFADAAAQEAVREALYFGRVHVADLGSETYAQHFRGHVTISSNAGLVHIGGGRTLPISTLRDGNWSNGAFILGHELFHFAARLQGRPYIPTVPIVPGGPPRIDPIEERSANCFAQRATGTHHPGVYYACN